MKKRREYDSSFQASLHGIDLKINSVSDHESVELNQEQKDLMKAASARALERKMKRG